MLLSEAIEIMVRAKRACGDIDLVGIHDDQFIDVKTLALMREPTEKTAWVWAGPVVAITFDPE